MMMMMIMMMMSYSLALGSIDLNAQCAEGEFVVVFFPKKKINRNREKSWEDIDKLRCRVSPADTEKESQSENRWVFRRLRNVAEETASLIVCGRAFQRLGAELHKALKPNCLFLVCFSVANGSCGNISRNDFLQVLRSIIASTMMRQAYRCAFHTICLLVLTEGPDPVCFNCTTKQELKYDTRFHWSAPLSSRSNWSDRMTESDGGSEP